MDPNQLPDDQTPPQATPATVPTPAPAEAAPAVSAAPIMPAPKRGKLGLILGVVLALLLAGATGYGGFWYGKQQTKPAAPVAVDAKLTVPEGATVISQCAKGRGTQYVLPKDIPQGPVYNVYQNQVIGIEFMIGKSDIVDASKNFLNLPLFGVKYDHVNVGLLSSGHAGFPSPHYHVDLFTVPPSVAEAITCK